MLNVSFKHKRFAPYFSLLLLVALSNNLLAQTRPKRKDIGGEPPNSILYVGNSFFYYNNSIHNHVLNLTSVADTSNKGRYRATSVTISGSGFNWHDMESYFRLDESGKYSSVGEEIVFNKPSKQFDAVIMSDCSQCPVHPKLKSVFHE